jgi:hypothetical protein
MDRRYLSDLVTRRFPDQEEHQTWNGIYEQSGEENEGPRAIIAALYLVAVELRGLKEAIEKRDG